MFQTFFLCYRSRSRKKLDDPLEHAWSFDGYSSRCSPKTLCNEYKKHGEMARYLSESNRGDRRHGQTMGTSNVVGNPDRDMA